MNSLCPNIVEFTRYWESAPMVSDLYAAMEDTYKHNQDGTVCTAKAMVECACKTIVQELDDPNDPIKLWPNGPLQAATPSLSNWVSAATRLLNLISDKTDPLNGLIGQYNKLAITLGTYRNNVGNIGHGRAGFEEKLTAHHRRAAILIADTIVGFLHDAYLLNQTDPARTYEPYERFTAHNKLIDQQCAFQNVVLSDDGVLTGEIVLAGGNEVIPFSALVSELLFGLDKRAYKEAWLASGGERL